VSLIVLDTRFKFETIRTSTVLETNGELWVKCCFTNVVKSAVGLKTNIPEKVAIAFATTLSCFETSGESFVEIGTPVLTTSTTESLVDETSVTPRIVVGL